MNMKRRTIGICIFVAVIVIFTAIFAGIYRRKEVPVPESELQIKVESVTETDTEKTVTSSTSEEPYLYIMFADDGRLSVYEADNLTLYLDTGISVESLPEERKADLDTGIRFRTQEELFDFLESYSS